MKCCYQTLPSSGGVPAGINPSLLTSAAIEMVQASQALQAVQAVQPLLHAESPPISLGSALQVTACGPLDAAPVYQVKQD